MRPGRNITSDYERRALFDGEQKKVERRPENEVDYY